MNKLVFVVIVVALGALCPTMMGCAAGIETSTTEVEGGWVDLTIGGNLPGLPDDPFSTRIEGSSSADEDAQQSGLLCSWAKQLQQPRGGDACLGHYIVDATGFALDGMERASIYYNSGCYYGPGSQWVEYGSEWGRLDVELTLPDEDGTGMVDWSLDCEEPYFGCQGGVDRDNLTGDLDCESMMLCGGPANQPEDESFVTLKVEWSCGSN